MKRLLAAFVLLGLALSFAQAAPREKVKLARKIKKGDRIQVKEQQHTETVAHWKGEGEGAVSGQEVEDVEREYLQEVVKESPQLLKREYKTSTRRKGNPKDDKLEPVRTSVHGKTVLMTPEGPKIEGAEISKEDRENLDTIERIAYACLPKDEVAQGDVWKLGDEIGRAVFGPGYDPQNFKTQGTGRLDSLKTIEGRKAAKIALKVSIEVKPTEVVPAIVLDLKGQATFLIEEGVFSDLVLEGTVTTDTKKIEDGKRRTFSTESQTAYRLKCEIAAGAPEAPPPKALSKDDELSKAEQVECSKGHKFPNRFLYCAQCGRELDKETRKCPGGCKPLLRFCPLCGEGLVPSK